MIKPIRDNILVSRAEPSHMSAGGIVLPAAGQPNRGKALAVGSAVQDICAGDVVIFGEFAGTEIEESGEHFLIIREEEILAITS